MHAMSFRPGLKGWLLMLVTVGAMSAGDDVTAASTPDPFASSVATAESDKGERIFLQCRACHVSEPGARHTVGPNLWNIVTRPVASQADFPYSVGLRNVGGTWDYDKLSGYLRNPRAMVPDTGMVFAGIERVKERADLIAHLHTLSDKPVALPRLTSAEARRARNDLSAEPMIDKREDWQGLPPGPGRKGVFYGCNSCHPLRLVTQQGMSWERWDETLEWMVEEQGMAEIEGAVTRDLILDCLSTHFGSR